MSLQITYVTTPAAMYPYKCPYAMTPTSLTIHETDNYASAMSEVSYMLSNYNETSYHFAVDDERAVQGLPCDRNGWHAGDGQGPGNRSSIGIEICLNYRNGQSTLNDPVYNPRYLKARANAIELAALLHIQFGWGVPRKGVTLFRHYDRSGKWCPRRMLNENYWDTFCTLAAAKYNELVSGKTVTGNNTTTTEKNERNEEFEMRLFYTTEGSKTVRYFDGHEVRAIAHPDEKEILNRIYKANTGKDIPNMHFEKSARWDERLAAVLKRKKDY